MEGEKGSGGAAGGGRKRNRNKSQHQQQGQHRQQQGQQYAQQQGQQHQQQQGQQHAHQQGRQHRQQQGQQYAQQQGQQHQQQQGQQYAQQQGRQHQQQQGRQHQQQQGQQYAQQQGRLHRQQQGQQYAQQQGQQHQQQQGQQYAQQQGRQHQQKQDQQQHRQGQQHPQQPQPLQKPVWGKLEQQHQPEPKPSQEPEHVPEPQQRKQWRQPEIQQSEQKETVQVAKDLSNLSIQKSTISSSKSVPISTIPHTQIQALNIVKRKNPFKAGTLGRKIEVLTNMMEIKFGPNFKSNIIHYDVEIVPNVPKYLMRPAYEAARKKLFPTRYPAFDGKKNLFSAGEILPDTQANLEVTVFNDDGKEKQFTVTIKKVNVIDCEWLKYVKPGIKETERDQISIQALDVILRSSPSMTYTQVGRSFFSQPKGHVMSLGGGMDLWTGIFQSAVLGWKTYLNVDVAHKAFPTPQDVIELMKTICGIESQDSGQQQGRAQQGSGRGQQGYGRSQQGYGRYQDGPTELTPQLISQYNEDIRKYLKGLKVIAQIPDQPTSRRTYRVNDLVKSPREDTFEHNNARISVEQYYKLEKNYQIKYPLLPCLWVGNKEKNIHVPPEICKIVAGQVTQRKLNEKQTSTMIRHAATGTEDRKRKIMNAFDAVHYNDHPCLKEFGISISGNFEKVPARVLDPPELKYEEGRYARVAKGVWRADKFNAASSLISNDFSWTVVNLDRRTDDRNIYTLIESLKKTASTVGVRIGNPLTPFKHIQIRGNYMRDIIAAFDELKNKKIQLIIVIVPDMKGPYSRVKQISELNIGVLTQCLKSKTLFKLSEATVVNILLKINAKLNGVNHCLSFRRSRPRCLERPVMIVGADVTHPSPDMKDIPSIAAVAASHDPNAFSYNVEIRLQPPRQEIIGDLKEIMINQLKYFKKKTNYQPEKIIFYRDGVSEGQFAQIMDAELQTIRKACLTLNQNYKPQITFLVVQKRHHIRLFPTDQRNSDDRNFNVQAGTIVDTNITHPTDIDFYLVSHASIQGTARPTKYRCLWDDSDMSEDEIEEMTYFLCHMFSRCTRSVSYPTPTYYAHLAAFRARALTQDIPIDINNLPQEQLKKLTIKPEVLMEKPMFFV